VHVTAELTVEFTSGHVTVELPVLKSRPCMLIADVEFTSVRDTVELC
jgi:hypothetical protein